MCYFKNANKSISEQKCNIIILVFWEVYHLFPNHILKKVLGLCYINAFLFLMLLNLLLNKVTSVIK